MRLLLLCDGEVGGRVFDWLVRHHRADLAAVVAPAEGAIADRVRAAGLPLFVGTDANAITAFCEPLGTIELGVLAWWPHIVKPPLIGLPRREFVNFHPSLLPYNRGKNYNFWVLVEQAPFGVTLHVVDEGIDTGDIVAQQPIPYDWRDTGETLYRKAADAIVGLFELSYPALRDGSHDRAPQSTATGSFHRAVELDPASRIELDQLYTARDLLNRLRARTFAGHPACRFEDEGATYEARVAITRVSE